MFLEQIEITGFRGISGLSVKLGQITALIGKTLGVKAVYYERYGVCLVMMHYPINLSLTIFTERPVMVPTVRNSLSVLPSGNTARVSVNILTA